ncbi:hypothetical protein [uncultured Roseivirga sp.]|uniref:hypothetical protein n=1 Tax=uncultured Roseivirga sp. TaxID=543088 RepID=UPI000D79B0E6|nr:hypothetical protein [uncultured Roseivirga sp.]PWL31748.1 MAG: hypothetical protein DCO95_00760 [Roseivirga sp. XM-24bin3]
MTTVKSINSIREARPEKGVWFDYHGDIFISVIPIKRKKHIRRKAKIEDGKRDNKMSVWHLEWQYENMETRYGVPVSGKKTYEVAIRIDDERHIIDSLIETVAVEFQHTLSVPLSEMDSRYIAHKKTRLIPYLVLDFTHLESDDIYVKGSELEKKLEKWLESRYYKADSLFIDCKDKMIRFCSGLHGGKWILTRDYFVDNLLKLENNLKIRRTKYKNDKAKKQREREERAREKEEQRKLEEREENREDKRKSADYKYFRRCFTNEVIKPYVLPYAKDLFLYYNYSEERKGYYEKTHEYTSQDRSFNITYRTVSLVKKYEANGKWGRKYTQRKYEYLFARVLITGVVGFKRFEYEFEINSSKGAIPIPPERSWFHDWD